jgi:hypothetical protein
VNPTDADPKLLYLEPNDEITSVIRRLRGADAGRVVLVAPGRSRATSSVVALRLLARAATDSGRSVALVADASTRALAGEAGIAAFASVADATSPTPSPAEPMTPTRAPIHVVRGAGASRSQPAKAVLATDGMEETVAVHLPPPTPSGSSGRGRVRAPRLPRWPWLVGLLVIAMAASAALLPGATVRITPATSPVAPQSFPVGTDTTGHATADLQATRSGTATGERPEQVPATGTVTFFNYSYVQVEVPAGTLVSAAGAVLFVTDERVLAPPGQLTGGDPPIAAGQVSVGITAVESGTGGNVGATAIDTVESRSVDRNLQGFSNQRGRRVTNPEATTGGEELIHPVIQQSDIDAVVAAIEADLQQQLTDALGGDPDRIYVGPPADEVTSIEVPPALLGTEDTPTFELTGSLAVDRAYGSRDNVVEAARMTMLSLDGLAGQDSVILEESISVAIHGMSEVEGRLDVQVTVTALAARRIDEAAVRELIRGKTIAEATAELDGLGDIKIDLWPAWVEKVPVLDFRIDIVPEVTDSDGGSPEESVTS